MNNTQLIDSFADFKEVKNINRIELMQILEDVLKTVIKREYGDDSNFDIIINADKGDLEIWKNREIVYDEELEFPELQITLTEAKKYEDDFEVGDDYTESVPLKDLGRRNIILIRQLLKEKIKLLYNEDLIKKYQGRIGEIVVGEVYQIRRYEIIVLDDDGNELILPKNHTINNEFFKKGESVKAVVHKVEIEAYSPKIILSRTDSDFLQRLLEQEIPELSDGLIDIVSIEREPGVKAKLIVESIDDRIDPVGACVGMRGSRINPVVRELNNESIDVINYTNNTNLFISRLLSPAKISSIEFDENGEDVKVYMESTEISKAIGKKGVNIRLASKVSGFNIDVYRLDIEQDEEDIELTEFNDEIDEWIIEEFKKVGLDTAKSILNLSLEELTSRTDLEDDTIATVLSILKEEFE